MKKIYISQVPTTMVILIALMMSLNIFTYGQSGSIGNMSNIVAGSDTLYFLDGRIISGNIFEYEQTEYVAYGIWDNVGKKLIDTEYIDKSELHYISIGNTYHLINEVSEQDNIERLRHNLLIYKKQSRKGMVTLTTGVSLLLAGSILAEIQQNRFEKSFDLDDINNMPTYLNYAGYGLMLVGGIIKIGSYEFLERGSIDITPVGVRVNF